jgi:hypothetical protein
LILACYGSSKCITEAKSAVLVKLVQYQKLLFDLHCSAVILSLFACREGVTQKAGCSGMVTAPVASITICEVVPNAEPKPIVNESVLSSSPM